MNFKKLFKDKLSLSLIAIGFLLMLVSFILIFLNIDKLSYPLIIHFNSFQGVDLTGSQQDLWNASIMTFVIFIINLLLSSIFYFRERVLTYLILFMNVFVIIFYLVGVSNIISLN